MFKLLKLQRVWDKEKIWSPCQDLNLLPPEHQAAALSTNLDSVSLSFIENEVKYSIAHQISLKHYTETESFSWQAFSINLFNLSLCVLLSFANDEISIIFICKLLNVNQHWGELNMTSLKKYMTSITSHGSPLRVLGDSMDRGEW